MEDQAKQVLGLAALAQAPKDGHAHAVFIGQYVDLSSLNMMVRSKAGEFVRFAFRQTAANLEDKPVAGKWDNNMDFIVHGVKAGALCLVLITSTKYPASKARQILRRQLQDVQVKLPAGWANSTQDRNVLDLKQQFQEFQNDKGGSVEQLQRELDETKGLVMDNIQVLIERERKLDEIMKDSEDLSAIAKEFATDTKKLAKCRCFGM